MKLTEPSAWVLTDVYSLCECDWMDRRDIRLRAGELESEGRDALLRRAVEIGAAIERWPEEAGSMTDEERLNMVREFLILDKALWLPWERLTERGRRL